MYPRFGSGSSGTDALGPPTLQLPKMLAMAPVVSLLNIDGTGLGFVGPAAAEYLLGSKRAEVEKTKRMKAKGPTGERVKSVVIIRLAQVQVSVADLGLRVGSFGIDEIHSEYGVYFQHKALREGLLLPKPQQRRKAA